VFHNLIALLWYKMSITPEDPQYREFQRTRKSLIERLNDWEDQKSWDDFYRTYWRLIYSVAIKSGLRNEEAFDAVQETIIAIAKQQKEGKYDSKQGSFKAWLMNLTRWRIADQFRKRKKDKDVIELVDYEDDSGASPIDKVEDLDGPLLERIWESEWKKSLTDRGIDRVKEKVSPRQYQIFDCYVVQGWEAEKVRDELGVSVAQVYLAKHRVGSILKKEIQKLEKELF